MLPFQPAVWLVAAVQILIAVLVYRGKNWARWLAAVMIVGLFLDSMLNSSWPGKYATFPAAAVRDAVSYAIELAAVGLLFLPASSTWFRHVRSTGAA